jgi:hypothetical protein
VDVVPAAARIPEHPHNPGASLGTERVSVNAPGNATSQLATGQCTFPTPAWLEMSIGLYDPELAYNLYGILLAFHRKLAEGPLHYETAVSAHAS